MRIVFIILGVLLGFSTASARTVAEYEELFAKFTKGTQDYCFEVLENPTDQTFTACVHKNHFSVTVDKVTDEFTKLIAVAAAADEYNSDAKIALSIRCEAGDAAHLLVFGMYDASASARMMEKGILRIKKGNKRAQEFAPSLMDGKAMGIQGDELFSLFDYLEEGEEEPLLIETMTDVVHLTEYKLSNVKPVIEAVRQFCPNS